MIEKTLYEYYVDLSNNILDWSYYEYVSFSLDINTLSDEILAERFIKDYFHAGRKNSVLYDYANVHNNLVIYRPEHTISTFLLGILLKKEFDVEHKDYQDHKDFLYFWYLVCLYHDVGYHYENRGIGGVQNINDFKNKENIQYDLLDTCLHSEVIRGYFNYRIDNCRKCDHGIAGALVFYDRLRRFGEKFAGDKLGVDNCPIGTNIQIHKDFLKHIERSATSIALHNIWKSDSEKTDKIYEKYNLDEYKMNSSKTLRFYDDSFTYLLAIADTLEPTKKCNRLEDIQMGFDLANKTVKISGYNEKIRIATLDLTKWVDVDVETYAGNHDIVIKLHLDSK